MPDIKISISTQAELAAAKALEQQLERDIGKAKILGENYDALAKKLEKVRGSIESLSQAQKDGVQPAVANAEATKKFGDEASKAAGKKSGLLNALKGLGEQVPIVSGLVRAGINPWTVIAIAVAGAWNQIEKWKASVERMKSQLAIWDDLGKRVGRFSELLKQARLDQEDFDRAAEKAKQEGDSPDDQAAAAEARVGRKFKATGQKLEAAKRLALAQVDEDEAKGLSKVEATKRRNAIEAGFGKRLEDNELAMRAEQAMVRRVAGQSAIGAADRAKDAQKGAAADEVAIGQQLDDAKELLDQARQFAGLDAKGKNVKGGRLGEIEDRLTEIRERSKFHPEKGTAIERNEIRRLEGEQVSLRSGVTTRSSVVSELESRQAAAQARNKDLQQQVTSGYQSGRALVRSANEMTADVGVDDSTARDVRTVGAQTTAAQQRALEAAEAGRGKSNEVSGRLANIIESTGGVMNATLSQMQAYEARIRKLEQQLRQQSDQR